MAPFDPDLLDALEASVINHVAGIAWRQVLAPTAATRANLRGARWNPLGVETLYTSLDPTTAAEEIDHLLAAQPVPIRRQRQTFPLHVALSRVADLRADPWGARFQYPYDINVSGACQLIGAAASWLQLGGLLVPSLRSSGDNLVIFVANLAPDDGFDAGDPFNYPPDPLTTTDYAPIQPT